MGNGMNKIIPGLYVGNYRDSGEESQLKENKITHILSVHDNAKPIRSDMIYLCISAQDVGTQDLASHFAQCNDFIHSARIYGGNVLVHCLAGMSRSVTITVAYLMTVTDLGWRDSLNVVRAARQVASPNYGFQKQLLTFQHEGVAQERERLLSTMSPGDHDDRAYVLKVLDEYESAMILEKYNKAKTGENVHRLSTSSPVEGSTSRDPHSIFLMDEMFVNPRSIRDEYYAKIARGKVAKMREERAERKKCEVTMAGLSLEARDGANTMTGSDTANTDSMCSERNADNACDIKDVGDTVRDAVSGKNTESAGDLDDSTNMDTGGNIENISSASGIGFDASSVSNMENT